MNLELRRVGILPELWSIIHGYARHTQIVIHIFGAMYSPVILQDCMKFANNLIRPVRIHERTPISELQRNVDTYCYQLTTLYGCEYHHAIIMADMPFHNDRISIKLGSTLTVLEYYGWVIVARRLNEIIYEYMTRRL